jgi:nucleoside-diphosphate-sugar epimerase
MVCLVTLDTPYIPPNDMTKLIFGCGYLGERVAKLWIQQGHMVMAVTRDENRALELGIAGMFTIGADVTKPGSLDCFKSLPRFSMAERVAGPNKSVRPINEVNAIGTVLYAVGHDRTSSQSIHEVYTGGVKNVLAALPSDVGRFIYISTTGVYGNAGGEWVDEDTPPDPRRDGGRASLAAEQVLKESRFADHGVVLRLAGLYGPGRIPFLDKLRAGEPIPAVSTGFLNLIHVDDAAAVVVAAIEHAVKRPVYCVSDGHPVERGKYYREVARLIGAAPPTFVTPDLNSPRAARAEADRRVKNARMLADLGVTLQYPDYRAGLAAILANG